MKTLTITILLFCTNAMADYDSSFKKCVDGFKWGYFVQDHKKNGGTVDIYQAKDLSGKFDSQEDCEIQRAQDKKETEPCEKRYLGKTIFENVFFAKFIDKRKVSDWVGKESFTYDSFETLFKTLDGCKKGIETGVNYKSKKNEVTTSDVKVNSKTSSEFPRFVGNCERKKIKICDKDQINVEEYSFAD